MLRSHEVSPPQPRPTTATEFRAVLRPAFEPCPHLRGSCLDVARWDPDAGHVPRGFVGAYGRAEDVKLVLLTAEPGDPLDGEFFSNGSPELTLQETIDGYYDILNITRNTKGPSWLFTKKLRELLDLCWPNMTLEEQLSRTWITDTVLCSAPTESGPVERRVETACANSYLKRQLALVPDALVVALGRKAFARCQRIGVNALKAFSIAPPGCNYKKARTSWEAVAEELRRRLSDSANDHDD